PRTIALLFIANGALFAYRLIVLLDLVRLDGLWHRQKLAWQRVVWIGGWLVLLFFLALPHVMVGYGLLRWYRFLTTTFPTGRARVFQDSWSTTPVLLVTPAIPSQRASPTSSLQVIPPAGDGAGLPPTRELAPPQPTNEPSATATVSPTVVLIPAPTPSPDPLAAALDDGRLVLLLIGTDAGPGRWSARADTIIVAVADLRTRRAALFGVPRNFVGLPIPPEFAAEYPQGYWPDLANALYTAGLQRADRFPGAADPGAAALASSLAQLLGLPIDYTATVDMGGFVRVVDALGGVTIDVPHPVATWLSPPLPGEDWRYYEIPVGRQHLDGHQALAYVRSRTGTSDYDRMQRQRCVLAALYRQAELPAVLLRLPQILDAVQGAVRTDVPLDALPFLVELALSIEPTAVVTVGLTPPAYNRGWADGGYPIPDPVRIQEAVERALTDEMSPPAETLPTACAWMP
ncbi:MAG: LCP family protein, partial [Thermomicrobium sp.]